MPLSDAQQRILRRAAHEVPPNAVINLGIGLPQALPAYLDAALAPDARPMIHSENGILGLASAAPGALKNINLIDAGGAYVGVQAGGAIVDSALSFATVRRGKIDVAFLGAFQVAANGDLANWHIKGKQKVGMGGAMEIAQCARKLVIVMQHQGRDGAMKILERCDYALTAARCVDTVITEKAVFQITPSGLHLSDIAEGVTLDDLRASTAAAFSVADSLETF